MRKKLTRNFIPNPDFLDRDDDPRMRCPHCSGPLPLMPKDRPPPFLMSVTVEEDGRVYQFEPGQPNGFTITVGFPVPDCGPPEITIGGKDLYPQNLQPAIDFVKENEYRFREAYEEAAVLNEPHRKELHMGQVDFDQLKKGRAK